MKPAKIPAYECRVGLSEDSGVLAVSFVECPAMEVNFIALREAAKPVKIVLNRAKQILTGPVLIPDKMIYRNDVELGEYYIKFTREDIERIAQKMMKTGIALQHTTHQHQTKLKGNYLTELWVVSDQKCDKAVALGLGELPAGTLVASYKVEDARYWRNEVLAGKVKGFSIEGIFNFNPINMAKTEKKPTPKTGKAPSIFKTNLAKFLGVTLEGETPAEADALATEAEKDETGSAEALMIFTLVDGTECRVDAEGFATLDGEQMPSGEHALDDGNVIVIDDAGMLVLTQPEGEGEPPAQAPAELAAKERAKTFLGKRVKPVPDTKTEAVTALEKRLETLSAELAAIKKEPSAAPAKPKDGNGGKEEKPKSFEARLARAVSLRIARKTNS